MSNGDQGTIEAGTTRERVAAVLRDDILDGRLGPGVTLRTRELVTRLGVSNSPLREAFFELAAEGLVEVTPNRGVVVAPLTRDGAADVIRIGSLLWEAAYRWLVPVLEPPTVDLLDRVRTDFGLSLRSGDLRSAVLDGERFGQILLDSSWSTELVRSVETVRPRLRRLGRLLASNATLTALGAVQSEVIKAAGSTDLDSAVTAMQSYFACLNRAVESDPRVAS